MKLEDFNKYLGLPVRDIVSGMTGICTCISLNNSGEVKIDVTPKGDGTTMPDGYLIDYQQVEIINDKPAIKAELTKTPRGLSFEKTYTDNLTGEKGVIFSYFFHLNGCCYVKFIPNRKDKDGNIIRRNINYLNLKEFKEVKRKKPTGGPNLKTPRF